MQDLYELIVRALKPRLPLLTTNDIIHTFATWELIPIERDNNLVGVALRKETELHLIIDPHHQNTICFLKESKRIVAETIAKYAYAETKVAKEHKLGHRLAKILGFSATVITNDTVNYRKEE